MTAFPASVAGKSETEADTEDNPYPVPTADETVVTTTSPLLEEGVEIEGSLEDESAEVGVSSHESWTVIDDTTARAHGSSGPTSIARWDTGGSDRQFRVLASTGGYGNAWAYAGRFGMYSPSWLDAGMHNIQVDYFRRGRVVDVDLLPRLQSWDSAKRSLRLHVSSGLKDAFAWAVNGCLPIVTEGVRCSACSPVKRAFAPIRDGRVFGGRLPFVRLVGRLFSLLRTTIRVRRANCPGRDGLVRFVSGFVTRRSIGAKHQCGRRPRASVGEDRWFGYVGEAYSRFGDIVRPMLTALYPTSEEVGVSAYRTCNATIYVFVVDINDGWNEQRYFVENLNGTPVGSDTGAAQHYFESSHDYYVGLEIEVSTSTAGSANFADFHDLDAFGRRRHVFIEETRVRPTS